MKITTILSYLDGVTAPRRKDIFEGLAPNMHDEWRDIQHIKNEQSTIPYLMMKHSGTKGEGTTFDPMMVEQVRKMLF